MNTKEQTKLVAPPAEIAKIPELDLDLIMNAAVGAIETYIEPILQKQIGEGSLESAMVEWYAHQIAIRIITNHAFGDVTY